MFAWRRLEDFSAVGRAMLSLWMFAMLKPICVARTVQSRSSFRLHSLTGYERIEALLIPHPWSGCNRGTVREPVTIFVELVTTLHRTSGRLEGEEGRED